MRTASSKNGKGRIADRARLLRVFTREALLFGGVHGFIAISEGRVHARDMWKRRVRRSLKEASDEVRECAKKAEFQIT
jgi:hypothetical protein